jgi:uncharacterized protein (TIGR02453 family)
MVQASESPPPPPFEGFAPVAFEFLRELAARQDREWMARNKAVYERSLRDPMASLVAAVSEGLAEAGSPLRGDPRRSVFRIHRDTRFSKDKRPYKTNIGATLTRDGAKLSPGLLYVHIDPAGPFLAAGFYHPEPPTLHRLRRRLAERPDEWRETRARLAEAGLELSRGEALTRPPRGYEEVSDPDIGDVLKLKSWIVSSPLEETDTYDPALPQRIVRFAQAADPLLSFGWTAIDG